MTDTTSDTEKSGAWAGATVLGAGFLAVVVPFLGGC